MKSPVHSPPLQWILSNYSPKWRWIDQGIHRAANAARWIYWAFHRTDTEVNNYNSIHQTSESVKWKITIFVFLCRTFESVNKPESWQLFRISVTISVFLVKFTRRIMFKSKVLYWRTLKPNLFAFFLLIGMAFSFIFENWASLKLSGNRNAVSTLPCAVMRARNMLGYS